MKIFSFYFARFFNMWRFLGFYFCNSWYLMINHTPEYPFLVVLSHQGIIPKTNSFSNSLTGSMLTSRFFVFTIHSSTSNIFLIWGTPKCVNVCVHIHTHVCLYIICIFRKCPKCFIVEHYCLLILVKLARENYPTYVLQDK